MPKENKANAVEKGKRIDLVVDMLLKGKTRQSVMAVLFSKYGLTVSMSDKYISQAKDRIYEDSAPIRRYEIGRAVMRYDELFYRSYSTQDWRACRLVQNSIDKLLGLNEPVRVDISASMDLQPINLSALSDEERKLLTKLLMKLKQGKTDER